MPRRLILTYVSRGMIAYLNGILPLFAVIALGYALRRFEIVPEGGDAVFNRFLFAVALPVFVFQMISGIEDASVLSPAFIGAMLIATASTGLLAFLAARATAPGPRVISSGTAVFSNSLFLGFPVCIALLGEGSAGPAAVAAVFFFVGPLLMTIVGLVAVGALGEGRALEALRREFLMSPFLIAAILGSLKVASGLELPVALMRFAELIAASAPPIALLTLGLFMARVRVPLRRPVVLIGTIAKIIVHPALTAMAGSALGLKGDAYAVAVLMSAMPPAVAAFVVAQRYGIGEEPSAAITLVATLVSLASLSIVVWLLI